LMRGEDTLQALARAAHPSDFSAHPDQSSARSSRRRRLRSCCG